MTTKRPKVRVMKIEKATYSLENPNPEWKDKGEKWIRFALSKQEWEIGETYDVAYIPHIPIEITQGNSIHNIMPTYWSSEKLPNASNFSVREEFRLNGIYKNPAHPYAGSSKKVDLSPIDDKEAILELLKFAERIYNPPA